MQLVGVPTADESFFTAAADRWTSVVIGDLEPRTMAQAPHAPRANCAFPDIIDNLYIFAKYMDIDGSGTASGNILGSSGPSWLRGSSFLPVTGYMQFDNFDLASRKAAGKLEDAILHEMRHVLGIGSLWAKIGVDGTKANNCTYTGARANAEYKAISNCDVVPTQQVVKPGRCGRWAENCLGAELMTPVLNSKVDNPLSRITMASLEDMGYTVNYAAADPFGAANLKCTPCTTTRRLNGLARQWNSSSSRQRTLSAKSYQMVMNYGKSALAQNRIQDTSRFVDDMTYVDDKVMTVLVKEGGRIYSFRCIKLMN